eukprot:INCI13558.1.p1 GENE.INCI13558.1~~INCI13558.1.p1  ORF type:complete len:304 (-),score=57.75 INCI13558.1:92-916(-)
MSDTAAANAAANAAATAAPQGGEEKRSRSSAEHEQPPEGTREEWIAASLKVLEQEKKLSKERARLAALRRTLPAYPLDKDYLFAPASPAVQEGGGAAVEAVPFRELFGDKNMLIVYHFMFDDAWDRGCSACSFFCDGFNGTLAHLLPRASMCAVAQARPEKLAALAKTKGWTMPFYSSNNSTFNQDFGVSFSPDTPPEERVYNFNRTWQHGNHAPGMSVFQLRGDRIFHTYSTFAAGLADFQTVFALLDITPEGRNETGGSRRSMYWLKHKEDY